jgi:SAM-dependent methyltransferase
LEATGERLVPSQQGDVAVEHLHRYAIAQELARGKVVLDLASGEGYGSSLISSVAYRVVGIDVSHEAVEHARATYRAENLQFLVGRCDAIPLEKSSIDLVVCFETIEHIQNHEATFDEFRRVLRPEGLLLLSTPDRDVYSGELKRDNPFHVHELSLDELEQLVAQRFRAYRFFRQRLVRGSLVLEDPGGAEVQKRAAFSTMRGDFSAITAEPGLARSIYLIVLAGNSPFALSASSYFESPSVHDDLVMELAMRRGEVLSLTSQLAQSEERLNQSEERLRESEQRLRESEHRINHSEERLRESERRLLDLENDLKLAESNLNVAQTTIASLSEQVELLRGITSSRFWKYTEVLRHGARLGVKLTRSALGGNSMRSSDQTETGGRSSPRTGSRDR